MKDLRIVLYGNGGSGNHGCEAIVRGTVQLCGKDNTYIIFSTVPEEDLKYGLNQIATIRAAKSETGEWLSFLKAYYQLKVKHNYAAMDAYSYLREIKSCRGKVDVAFSVGGDNYCYSGTDLYAYLNRIYHDNGIKTVFWGCSVEPEVVRQTKIADDLRLYNQITARENITYEAIKSVNLHTWLMPDPAFYMEPSACNIDERYEKHQVIGINISPMIISYEKHTGAAFQNYVNLVRWILDKTNYDVALIPHVVWKKNDDRKILKQLYDLFEEKDRLILEKDHSAPELKYIISKCHAIVAARTHASIAAYSTGVPTLVVGYSVKARGIARDLFGTENNYILSVQDLEEPGQLCTAFQWLDHHNGEIRSHLKQMLPDYLKNGREVMQDVFAKL